MLRTSRWHYILPLSEEIGMGHLVRCHRLASQCEGCDHEFTVLSDRSIADVERLLRPFPTTVRSSDEDDNIGVGGQFSHLVVDIPRIPNWVKNLSLRSTKNLVLGSSLEQTPWANLIVNVAEGQALTSKVVEYEGEIRILQGAGFALLPSTDYKPLTSYETKKAPLVVFGGTDAGKRTLAITQALVEDGALGKPTVVASCHHPDWDELLSLMLQDQITLFGLTSELPKLIQSASVVVTAPGNTLFECLAYRTPAIAIAANERQARDFSTYPWLMVDDVVRALPQMLRKLLIDDSNEWMSYAEQVKAGQYSSVICEWMQHTNFDLRGRVDSLGLARISLPHEPTKC